MGRVEEWTAAETEVLATCAKQDKALQAELTDLESCSRRNNIHIFGVTEGEDGNRKAHYENEY